MEKAMYKEWMKEYEEKLKDKNCNYNQVKNFLRKHIPQKLYKYCSINEEYDQSTLDGIIHFNKPSEFNDPFDSSVRIDWKRLGVDRKKLEIIKEKQTNKSQEVLNDAIQYIQDSSNNVTRNIQDMFYVTCFSQTYRQILMWSHYANKHKGYCVEYDCGEDFELRNMLYPVVYEKQRYDCSEIYNCMDNAEYLKNLQANPILFKSPEWEYEEEWRVFCSQDYLKQKSILDKCNYQMKQKIKTVYLGIKFNEKTNSRFIEMCEERGINVVRLKMDDSEFKLIPIVQNKCSVVPNLRYL